MRLNQTLLDPNGFLALRARAGVRLKRRASPTGGAGGGDISKNNSRRRRNGDDFLVGTRGASNANRRLPNNIARLKALSSSGTWSDARVYGRSNSTPIRGTIDGGGGGGGGIANGSIGKRMAEAAAAAGAHGGDDDDDDHPPLLDALVPTKRNPQQAGAGAAPTPTPRSSSGSWLTAVTPKDQPTSSSWGGGSSPSPWMNGSTPQRPDKEWLKRIAASGGSISSPTGSSSSFSFSGESATESPWGGGGMVMHFPPPPQSLLPVFDRELHGFDCSARDGERWGELPFVVVESWGGLGKEVLPPGETHLLHVIIHIRVLNTSYEYIVVCILVWSFL